MTKIATIKGYTAQAKYYATNMATDANEDWNQAGWTKLVNSAVKPVFTLLDGRHVVIMDGPHHLTVCVHQVLDHDIQTTEEACWTLEGGR